MNRVWTAPPIFLDRDGTLIEEVHFLSALEEMRLIAGTAQAVCAANEAGHPMVVVSNQSGVARGYFDEAFVRKCMVHLEKLLALRGSARSGAVLAGQYYCPYHPDGLPPYDREHPDRKPGAGMLLRAASELGFDLGGAWMIGDRCSDLETGAGHGVIPLLVRTGYGRETERSLPENFERRGGRVFDNISGALAWIVGTEKA